MRLESVQTSLARFLLPELIHLVQSYHEFEGLATWQVVLPTTRNLMIKLQTDDGKVVFSNKANKLAFMDLKTPHTWVTHQVPLHNDLVSWQTKLFLLAQTHTTFMCNIPMCKTSAEHLADSDVGAKETHPMFRSSNVKIVGVLDSRFLVHLDSTFCTVIVDLTNKEEVCFHPCRAVVVLDNRRLVCKDNEGLHIHNLCDDTSVPLECTFSFLETLKFHFDADRNLLYAILYEECLLQWDLRQPQTNRFFCFEWQRDHLDDWHPRLLENSDSDYLRASSKLKEGRILEASVMADGRIAILAAPDVCATRRLLLVDIQRKRISGHGYTGLHILALDLGTRLLLQTTQALLLLE